MGGLAAGPPCPPPLVAPPQSRGAPRSFASYRAEGDRDGRRGLETIPLHGGDADTDRRRQLLLVVDVPGVRPAALGAEVGQLQRLDGGIAEGDGGVLEGVAIGQDPL